MSNLPIKENYKKNGYVLIKNIFSKKEIDEFRNFIKFKSIQILGDVKSNYKNLTITNLKDILSYPELRNAILNKNLIQILRYIFDDEPVYWGYSSFRWNEKVYRSFHNDAKNDFKCPFSTDYPLIRIGIYLQDHSKFSNGLKIWSKSCHTLRYGRKMLKKIFKDNGSLKYLIPQQLLKSTNVDIEVGDVVIWNLRTCHSGGALRIKPFVKKSFHPIIENFIEKFFPKLLVPQEKDRGVIFATFGVEGADLDNFIKDNLNHPELKCTLKNSNFFEDTEVLEKSRRFGLKLKKVV